MTYEERLFELTSEMIKAMNLGQLYNESPVEVAAKLCLKMQAEAYENAAHDLGADEEAINSMLQMYGYLPEPPPTPKPENWKL